ncbi:MAG: FkbM family methyltransferase [Burkholderiales bacterium]|nr:FkbM family methyltransferase [Burkholderiales bacterium]
MTILDHLVDGNNKQRPLLERMRSSAKPVMLYGAGVYAYVLKRFLEANGITVSGVMVDAAYKTEDAFMGAKVVTTEELVDRLGDFHFVVGITNVPVAVERLEKLGAPDVHVIDIPDYLNMPDGFMDMAFVKANVEQFERASQVFADDLSRQTYIAAINTKINENLDYVRPHVRVDNLYFPKTEFALRENEVFLDVGGFTGDTIREFHHVSGGRYNKIISLEPFEDNFARLVETVNSLDHPRVVPIKVGAWDEKTSLSFATNDMDIDNKIAEGGSKTIEVEPIDAIMEREGSTVTLIKTDINGAEYRALAGARKTIQRDRPRVITRLHLKEDFFRIPLLLRDIAPDIKIYLRQRGYFSMMVILYAEFD